MIKYTLSSFYVKNLSNFKGNNFCVPCKFYSNQYGNKEKTYYEVLKLNPNCSTEDIRVAFLNLSKQYHPDVNVHQNSTLKQNDFVEILEAYNVLRKDKSRREYDDFLKTKNLRRVYYTSSRDNESTTYNTDSFYTNRTINKNEPYYGIKGIKRVSNFHVVGFIIGCAIAFIMLEFVILKNGAQWRRDELDRKSKEAGQMYDTTKAHAEKYGQVDEQLKQFLDRLEKSSRTR